VIKAAVQYTHWPTLGLGVLAFVIMYGLRRIDRRIPNVLVAVAVTTIISWATGYERNIKAPVQSVSSKEAQQLVGKFNDAVNEINKLANDRAALSPRISEAEEQFGPHSRAALI